MRLLPTSACAIVSALLAIACGPPDAPDDLDALTHFLYREWNNQTPSVMEDGVAKLDTLLNALPLDGGVGGRSFRVTELTRDDLHDVAWPSDRNPKNAIGSCVARRSKWPIEDNARFIGESDQLDAEPTAKSYVRTFLDPMDPACFIDGTCPVLLTDNDIKRENTLITVEFTLHKLLRWVPLVTTRRAIAARSYIDHEFKGSKSGTSLKQSYSIDVFLGQDDGSTVRYQCSWAETDINLAVDEDLQLSVLVSATNDALAATDDAIEKRYHTP